MRRELYSGERFKWIDLSHPSAEELAQIQAEYRLHPAFLQDCLEPAHLPKYERLGNVQFTIVRLYDYESTDDAGTVQELTRKVAIFVGQDYLITIHRLDPDQFQELTDLCLHEVIDPTLPENPNLLPLVLVKFLNRALRSFNIPIEKAEAAMDAYETELFDREGDADTLQGLHIVRRRLALIKRILHYSQDMVHRLSPPGDVTSPLFQDLRENVSTLLFHNDDLLDDVTNLLNLHISLASQKTNEVMRVLTVFSVFFMPLTFIVGVYGMNFQNMPELRTEYGYYYTWGVMSLVTLVIAIWFYRRGWLVRKRTS